MDFMADNSSEDSGETIRRVLADNKQQMHGREAKSGSK
jgi:hypothetical protein